MSKDKRASRFPTQGKFMKCPICNKRYLCFPEWVYKRRRGYGYLYFCTYGCMRKYERERGRIE
jgi:hypothetical protein